MKKNLWVTVTENDVNGNLHISINGTITFLAEDSHRQLWSMLKGGTTPKCVLSFVPPNHENAVRVVPDFSFKHVQRFIADIIGVPMDFITSVHTCTKQTIVKVVEEGEEYIYSVDHSTF